MKYRQLFITVLIIILFSCSITTIYSVNTNNTIEYDVVEDITDVYDTYDNPKNIQKAQSLKKTEAQNIMLENQEAVTKYGGQITYKFTPSDVDEGKTTLYVNNTQIETKNITHGDDSFTWQYGDENILNTYPMGQYDMKIQYTNKNNTIDSNNAKLTIHGKEALLYIINYTLTPEDTIQITMELVDDTGYEVTTGNITLHTNGEYINSVSLKNNTPSIIIPKTYAGRIIDYTYSDGNKYYYNTTQSQLLDIILPGNGEIETKLEIINTSIIYHENTYKLLINTNITTLNNTQVTKGYLEAYNKTKLITKNNNTTSIIIPIEYNMEDITYKYIATDKYNNTTLTTNTYTPQIDTKLYIPYLYGYKGGTVTIYTTITTNYAPIIDGSLTLYINNNHITTIDNITQAPYYIPSVNSTIIGYTMDLNDYIDGEYTITAEYYKSKVYMDVIHETTLNIRKINTYIYAYNSTIYKNTTTILSAQVYANNKQEVNEGMVSFIIDNQLIATQIVENNTAQIEYTIPTTLSEGKHTLFINYSGTSQYTNSTKEITLYLTKTSTTTTSKSWTIDETEAVVLNTSIRAYNKIINTGEVIVCVNGVEIARSDVSNSNALIRLPHNITPGNTHNLTIKYTGSDTYTESTYENSNYTFNKKNTTLRIYAYLKRNGTLTATGYLYSQDYSKLNKGIVYLYINDTLVEEKLVENNKINFTHNMYEYGSGNYTIKIRYNGTILYMPVENTTSITKNTYLEKTYMKLSEKTIYTQKQKTIQITATISVYSGNIRENIRAQLKIIDDKENIDVVEDLVFYKGLLQYNYTLPSNITNNDYKLVIQSVNSTHYKETNSTVTLSVGGEYTTMYQKNFWTYKESSILFNTTLNTRDKSIAITNTTAIINIYTNNTSGLKKVGEFTSNFINGILSYNYTLPSHFTNNTYFINITSTSNEEYKGTSRLVIMNLNNRRTYLTVNTQYTYIGKPVIFNGTLIDGIKRTQINTTNGHVSIQLNGIIIATTQIKNGKFNYIYKEPIPAGNHTITYIYNGDNIYNRTIKNSTLTVNKNTLKIQSNTITTHINDKITINATITDYERKIISTPLRAAILLNGIKIADNITINNGKMIYNYTVTSLNETNNITIQVHESSNYKACSQKIILKIQKEYQFINVATTQIKAYTNSKIHITGNITDKHKKLVTTNTTLTINIAGKNISSITTNTGRYSYEYTLPADLGSGTYDVVVMANENSKYYYNAKYMTLQVV